MVLKESIRTWNLCHLILDPKLWMSVTFCQWYFIFIPSHVFMVQYLPFYLHIQRWYSCLFAGMTENLSKGFDGSTASPENLALAFYGCLWSYGGWWVRPQILVTILQVSSSKILHTQFVVFAGLGRLISILLETFKVKL
jgi:hypothetical protein